MELFKLFGRITVDSTQANNEIDQTTEHASQAGSKLGSIFSGIGKAAVKIGELTLAGVGAAATGIALLSKKSLDAYADYEQLVGGVETLFGTGGLTLTEYAKSVGKTVVECRDKYNQLRIAQDMVMKDAEEAYRTCGLSANEYMENVTSFSASLIAALNGDTEKAAQKSNQIMVQMSDNANKMGTSMESIQNAYNGFAKQNYTMLDNLKLGYGGTKEEMERLLSDAEKLPGALGRKFDISNYADVCDAIKLVQDEMGITGTTAKEAASTISGSVGMMKAAWENFITAMGNEDADPSEQLNKFLDSVNTVADNIIPRIQIILPRLIEGLTQLVNNLLPQIPALLSAILPTLVQGSSKLLQSLFTTILPQIPALLQQLVTTLLTNLTPLLQVGKEMIGKLLNGFVSAVPNLIEQGLPMLMQLSGSIREHASTLVDSGIDLIMRLADGIISGIPTMLETIPTILSNIAGVINDNAPKLLKAGLDIIIHLVKGIIDAIPVIIQEFPKIIQAIIDIWNAINWINLGKNLVKAIKDGVKELPNIMKNLWSKIKEGASSMWQTIKNAILHPVTATKTGVSNTFNAMKSAISTVFNAIKTLATTTFNAVKTAITNPIKAAKDVVHGVVDAIKAMFKFEVHLPHIALPHFSIEPSGWQLGDLLKGKIPHLGIEWYAKAMDEPYVFTKPTVYGNKGFGDAGDEMVYGHDNLMRDIREASNTDNPYIQDKLNRIIELLEKLTGMKLTLDSGALVGELIPAIDSGLGAAYDARERGGRSTW